MSASLRQHRHKTIAGIALRRLQTAFIIFLFQAATVGDGQIAPSVGGDREAARFYQGHCWRRRFRSLRTHSSRRSQSSAISASPRRMSGRRWWRRSARAWKRPVSSSDKTWRSNTAPLTATMTGCPSWWRSLSKSPLLSLRPPVAKLWPVRKGRDAKNSDCVHVELRCGERWARCVAQSARRERHGCKSAWHGA